MCLLPGRPRRCESPSARLAAPSHHGDSPPPTGSWPWPQRLLWLLLCGLAVVWLGPKFVRDIRPSHAEILDFFQEWASARNRTEGLPIYTPQALTMRRYLEYQVEPDGFQIVRNAHPPTSVLLALPLARLDYSDAFLVWSLLSLTALAVSLWLVVRQLRIPFRVWSLLPTVALLLVCNPFRQQMIQGQLNLFLLLLIVGIWVADRTGRPLWAGTLLGAVTAIKLFPGLLFVYFLFRRQWAVLAAGIVSVVLLTLLTAAVFGPSVYDSYVREAMPEVAEYYDKWPNISLTGFWLKLFDGRTGRVTRVLPLWYNPLLARTLIVVSGAVVLFYLARAIRRAQTRLDCDQAFGLTLIAMLLLSPITWDHYAVLLLLPLALLWLRLPPRSERRVFFWVCTVALWLTPMVYWAPLTGATIKNWMTKVAEPWQTLTALSPPTYALVGLFALGLSLTAKRTRINNFSPPLAA